MLNIITDENDALDVLKRKSAYTVDPTLDEANDLLPILRECQQAKLWVASAAFTIGDVMIPVTRTGNRFKCVQSGTTGATEPTWSVSQPSYVYRDSIYQDGAVIWREAGVEFSLWDIRRACYLSWQLKIDKVSCQYDFKAGDSTEYMSKRIELLERQRNRYAPITIA